MNALRASVLLYRYGPFYIANRFFLMMFSEWLRLKSDKVEYGQVEVDGFTWFSLAGVELHLWVCFPSNAAINLDRLPDGNSYASGVRNPRPVFVLYTNDMVVLTHVDAIPNHRSR